MHPAAETKTNRPRLALVLGGGSVRGAAHLGVVSVLEREGIRPDLIDGETLARIGDGTGRTRQHVHKLAASFRRTTGLKP